MDGGSVGVYETPWAACALSDSDVCPHNFLTLDDGGVCRRHMAGTVSVREGIRVLCCLLTPVVEMKVSLVVPLRQKMSL